MRSAVVVTRSLLDIAIKLMNHFPLFALLLRIKDPRRLPGPYIQLHICSHVDDRGKGTTYFRVVRDKGHPVLLLEVHQLANTGQQIIYTKWHRYKRCLFGQFSCNMDFHKGNRPNKRYFKEVEIIFMRWYDVTQCLFNLISRESQLVGSGSFGPIRAPVCGRFIDCSTFQKPQTYASVTGAP